MPVEKKIIVSCPTCKKTVLWNQQPNRPFCSERCKLIDLGEWAAEEKRIAGESVHPESDYDSLLH
jgi:endogenous inhibitor of DNA gyrase (YacG/DUF329 family)